jgi:HD-like signal output (HDOD) protein
MFSFFKKQTNPKTKLKKILKGYELPSFPAVVMQILQKIRSPYSSVSSIAESLSLDPGISVKVLAIANSAAFSPSKRVENLTQAIALVGLSQPGREQAYREHSAPMGVRGGGWSGRIRQTRFC